MSPAETVCTTVNSTFDTVVRQYYIIVVFAIRSTIDIIHLCVQPFTPAPSVELATPMKWWVFPS